MIQNAAGPLVRLHRKEICPQQRAVGSAGRSRRHSRLAADGCTRQPGMPARRRNNQRVKPPLGRGGPGLRPPPSQMARWVGVAAWVSPNMHLLCKINLCEDASATHSRAAQPRLCHGAALRAGGAGGVRKRLVPLCIAAAPILGPPRVKAGAIPNPAADGRCRTWRLKSTEQLQYGKWSLTASARTLSVRVCNLFPFGEQLAAAPDFTHQHDVRDALWLSKAPTWVAETVSHIDSRDSAEQKVSLIFVRFGSHNHVGQVALADRSSPSCGSCASRTIRESLIRDCAAVRGAATSGCCAHGGICGGGTNAEPRGVLAGKVVLVLFKS